MKRSNRVQTKSEAWKLLNRELVGTHSRGDVFRDWLDLMLLAYLSFSDNVKRGNREAAKFDGKYNDEYLSIVGRYKSDAPNGKRPMDYFSQAHALLIGEMEETHDDVLGEIYMKEISLGEKGQFFTPSHIAEFMAQVSGVKDGERVIDPSCGSGTMLLSAAKQNPNAYFYGTDLDERCAKMCCLNLFLYGLRGGVRWGNTLTGEGYKEWTIRAPFIFQIDDPPNAFSKVEEVKPQQQALFT